MASDCRENGEGETDSDDEKRIKRESSLGGKALVKGSESVKVKIFVGSEEEKAKPDPDLMSEDEDFEDAVDFYE